MRSTHAKLKSAAGATLHNATAKVHEMWKPVLYGPALPATDYTVDDRVQIREHAELHSQPGIVYEVHADKNELVVSYLPTPENPGVVRHKFRIGADKVRPQNNYMRASRRALLSRQGKSSRRSNISMDEGDSWSMTPEIRQKSEAFEEKFKGIKLETQEPPSSPPPSSQSRHRRHRKSKSPKRSSKRRRRGREKKGRSPKRAQRMPTVFTDLLSQVRKQEQAAVAREDFGRAHDLKAKEDEILRLFKRVSVSKRRIRDKKKKMAAAVESRDYGAAAALKKKISELEMRVAAAMKAAAAVVRPKHDDNPLSPQAKFSMVKLQMERRRTAKGQMSSVRQLSATLQKAVDAAELAVSAEAAPAMTRTNAVEEEPKRLALALVEEEDRDPWDTTDEEDNTRGNAEHETRLTLVQSSFRRLDTRQISSRERFSLVKMQMKRRKTKMMTQQASQKMENASQEAAVDAAELAVGAAAPIPLVNMLGAAAAGVPTRRAPASPSGTRGHQPKLRLSGSEASFLQVAVMRSHGGACKIGGLSRNESRPRRMSAPAVMEATPRAAIMRGLLAGAFVTTNHSHAEPNKKTRRRVKHGSSSRHFRHGGDV